MLKNREMVDSILLSVGKTLLALWLVVIKLEK